MTSILLIGLIWMSSISSQEGERLLAEGMKQASRPEEARQSLEGAVEAFRQAHDLAGEARALKELGNLYLNSNDPAKAAEIFRSAVPVARNAGSLDLEARMLNNLGLALLDVEGDSSARSAFEQSLAIAAKDGNEEVEAIALGNLADVDLAQGDARRALPRLERAAALARKLGKPGLAAKILFTLARTYGALGDHREAIRLYEEAMPHAQAAVGPLGEANVLNGMGLELLKLGRAQEAVPAQERALKIARDGQDRWVEAAVLQVLALAHEKLGDSTREADAARGLQAVAEALDDPGLRSAAQRHLEGSRRRGEIEVKVVEKRQSLAAALEKGDRAAAVPLAYDLGLLLLEQIEIGDAAAAWDQSLVLAWDLQDWMGQALALQALLDIDGYLAGDPEYLTYLEHMERSAAGLELGELKGALLIRRGTVRLNQDPPGAIPLLEEGLALAAAAKLQRESWLALEALSLAERLVGRPARAAAYSERLEAEARQANDDIMVGVALHQLAGLAQDQGNYARAVELDEQSLAKIGDVPELRKRRLPVLLTLGASRFGVGDYTGSFLALQQLEGEARAVKDRKSEAQALQGQASALLVQGRLDAAAERLAASLILGRSLGDQALEFSALSTLGTLAIWDGEHREAVEHLQSGLEVARRPGSPLFAGEQKKFEALALGQLSRAHAELGETARALELADAAVALAGQGEDDLGMALALDARAYVHYRAHPAERLAQAESDARAAIVRFESARAKLDAAELARAAALDQQSSLYDLLQQILIRRGQPAEALAAAELGRARSFAEALGGGTQAPSREDLSRFARDLGVTVIAYSVLHDPARILLPGRSEGLQGAFELELAIWVVRPDGEIAFQSFDLRRRPEETLNRRARFLLDLLGTETEPRDLLRDLHDQLIAPIAGLLPGDPEAPVVIVPHGVLFLVPFPALLGQDGRYLAEKHTLLTVPSIKSLDLLQARPAERGAAGALVVGNPDTPLGSPLPAAEKEARDIAAQLGTRAVLGRQATEAAVVQRMPGSRLIHLASHGRPGLGDRPAALALAPSEPGEDGLLTSAEVRDLRLSADLVVLSACESGVGRISGDGVMGLPRAFLAAGAAGVVMSLWRIDDEATSDLMIDFHRRLAAADPARALRQAMLAAIERGQGPGSWAAFSYVGAPKAPPDRLSAP